MIHDYRRLIVILCLTQGLCLCVGFWVHHRFEAAWHQLGASAEVVDAGAEMTPAAEAPEIPRRGWAALVPTVFAIAWTFGLQSAAALLLLRRYRNVHQREAAESREESQIAARELLRTRDAIIFGLAKLAESRDPETGQHLERISLYSIRLATALRHHPRYRPTVSNNFVRMIGISSVLHDIGKVGVEDAVLLKPGRLSGDERFRIQLHARLGGDCIRQIERRLGNSHFLRMAREIADYHHERWDGTGYPDGLKGESIPLSARIVAIADVYDALASKRVYKPAMPHEECVEEIRRGAGTQFDPYLVDVFLSIQSQFREVAERFSDSSSPGRKLNDAQVELLDSLFASTNGGPASSAQTEAASDAECESFDGRPHVAQWN